MLRTAFQMVLPRDRTTVQTDRGGCHTLAAVAYHLGQVGMQADSRESAEARQSRTDLILLMCAFDEVSQ